MAGNKVRIVLDDDLLAATDAAATALGKTRSEYIRDVLRMERLQPRLFLRALPTDGTDRPAHGPVAQDEA